MSLTIAINVNCEVTEYNCFGVGRENAINVIMSHLSTKDIGKGNSANTITLICYLSLDSTDNEF